jgi:DNA/RNA-binding domain of Phe-tRNA-synthetase-like protein
MPDIHIDPEIALKLGYLQLSHCRVAPSSDALRGIQNTAAGAVAERFAHTAIAEDPVVAGIRQLFKSVGIDPSRYRPSGEALVRRIIKGQGLYQINCIVDINNICSIESLFPLGAYDRKQINGGIEIRLGKRDENYRGIGRAINIEGKLVSADHEGAFGSPIADSERTKITESSREILVLLYAPVSTDDVDIRDTLKRFANLAGEFAAAQTVDLGIHAKS